MTMLRRIRLGLWAMLLPAVLAVSVLSGCVVEPAYGPGYYRGGGYGYGNGYYRPYYRDRDDYYRRW